MVLEASGSFSQGQRKRVGLPKAFLNCSGYFRRKTRHHSDAKDGDSYDPYDFSDTEKEMPQGKRVSLSDNEVAPLAPDVLFALCFAFYGGPPIFSAWDPVSKRFIPREPQKLIAKLWKISFAQLFAFLLGQLCSSPSLAPAPR